MRSKETLLFLVPNDWSKNPRLSRELHALKKTNLRIVIISTRLFYLTRSGASISSAPSLSGVDRHLTVYSVPLIVTPLASARLMALSKLAFAMLHCLTAALFVFWLLLLSLAVCVSRNVRVIHAHNSPDLTGLVSYMISKIKGTPYVYEVHDLVPEMYAEMMNLSLKSLPIRMLHMIEHIALSNSMKTIFVSKSMRDYVLMKHKLEASKCVVIYSSWDLSFIKSLGGRRDSTYSHSLDEFMILYVGSLEAKIRGLEDLVQATRILLDIHPHDKVKLVFVGEGPMRPYLTHLAKECGMSDSVIFAGALPREEAWQWLEASDIAVIPFRRFCSTEIAAPNKLFEYMAAGKAVVVSDLIGMREIIRNGYNGVTYRQGDPADLAEEISMLMEAKSSGRLYSLGSNARKDFLNFYSWERQEPKLLAMYDDLLSGRH